MMARSIRSGGAVFQRRMAVDVHFPTRYQALEVFAVLGLLQGLGQLFELREVDPALDVGNLLETRDFEALPLLDHLHKPRGVHEGVVRASIQPGKAAAEEFDIQLPTLEVSLVDAGDFELAARGRFDL